MSNPLKATKSGNAAYRQAGWLPPAEKVAAMNRELAEKGRHDIEWSLDGNGGFHLDIRADWSDRRAQEIAEKNEAERKKFNHRLRYPLSAGAEQ